MPQNRCSENSHHDEEHLDSCDEVAEGLVGDHALQEKNFFSKNRQVPLIGYFPLNLFSCPRQRFIHQPKQECSLFLPWMLVSYQELLL